MILVITPLSRTLPRNNIFIKTKCRCYWVWTSQARRFEYQQAWWPQ